MWVVWGVCVGGLGVIVCGGVCGEWGVCVCRVLCGGVGMSVCINENETLPISISVVTTCIRSLWILCLPIIRSVKYNGKLKQGG